MIQIAGFILSVQSIFVLAVVTVFFTCNSPHKECRIINNSMASIACTLPGGNLVISGTDTEQS